MNDELTARPTGEEEDPGTPAYLVLFCNLMTILLAFFIMLQAFGAEPECGLFYAGQGSFKQALENFGIPGILSGAEDLVQYPHTQPRYWVRSDQGDEESVRTIDAELEELLAVLNSLTAEAHAEDDPRAARERSAIVVPVRFAGDGLALDDEAAEFLDRLVADLASQRGGRREVYVRGYAPEARQRRWSLACRRAAVVADYLRKRLRSDYGSPEAVGVGVHALGYAGTVGEGTDARPQRTAATERIPQVVISIVGASR